MDTARQERLELEEAGFRVGTVAGFFGLTPEEDEFVEIKVTLSRALKRRRSKSDLSQTQLTEKVGSSQSRVANIEAGGPHVSLDLLVKALVASGTTRSELADVLAARPGS